MPPYYYYNTLGNKVSTTTLISFCGKEGPMSMCKAYSVADQKGCKYRRPSTYDEECCMYYREPFGGACDNPWAQAGTEMPKFD